MHTTGPVVPVEQYRRPLAVALPAHGGTELPVIVLGEPRDFLRRVGEVGVDGPATVSSTVSNAAGSGAPITDT
ncbi:MAG: hypothetical protein V5A38_12585, partial [Halolamina sp.]|uniref:hypothetical protein n=1 Tax=Halolamina sp. TaxID=1940283 RepID=UPI002FC35E51